jgi:hypothetical protein
MNEVLLPPLRSHVPGVDVVTPKPTWHLPLHVYTTQGLDLDFGPLLLFDKAVIDSNSRDFIERSSRPELKPLASSIKVLMDEGFLEERDFGSGLALHRSAINHHVQRLVEDPLPIRAPYLRGIQQYRSTLAKLKSIGISEATEILDVGFGMHLLMMQRHGSIQVDEKQRLDQLMISKKRKWTEGELDDVRSLIMPTVTYLYQNIVLGEMYGMPFMDADYTSEMYSWLREESLLVFNPEVKDRVATIKAAQSLFHCVVPELRPSSAKTMVGFLKSSALKDFRAFVLTAAKNGEVITDATYRQLLHRTLAADRRYLAVKSGIGWGERALSLIPGAGFVITALSIVAEKIAHRRIAKGTDWVYALIEAAKTEIQK